MQFIACKMRFFLFPDRCGHFFFIVATEIFNIHFKDQSDSNSRYTFIAVILSLYDPDILQGWKVNLKYGIRKQIALLYSVDETVISHNLQTVRNYYAIYRNFKKSVDYISDQIKEQYAERVWYKAIDKQRRKVLLWIHCQ